VVNTLRCAKIGAKFPGVIPAILRAAEAAPCSTAVE
jgi:hypothetical protein